MNNYLELLKDVRDNGIDKADRTGIGRRSVYGRMLRYNLSDGFPIVTTRKLFPRIAFEELMFFLRGETNTKLLEEKNVNIWKGNSSREFLNDRGLYHLEEGDIGKSYGWQIRHWETPDHADDYDSPYGEQYTFVKETDQFKNLIDGIRNDRYSSRHIITHWNPGQLDQAALPPCHLMHMYSVIDDKETGKQKLNSSFQMRSSDIYLGLPTNLIFYGFLNHIIAQHLDMIPGELVYFGWDVHLYQNQMKVVNEQLTREPQSLPKIKINKSLTSFEDILDLQWTDIEIIGYNPLPALEKVEMAI